MSDNDEQNAPTMSDNDEQNAPTMSDNDEQNAPTVVHHPTLYFADGNLVLSARGTQPAKAGTVSVLFRIQKSLLAASSDVFRDMLDLPEAPPGVNKTHEGALVIEMPDSAKEIEDILNFFYKPWELQLRKGHPDTYFQLNNLLAMATKYNFAEVRSHIVSYIQDDWPKTLEEWDIFDNQVKIYTSATTVERTKEMAEPASSIVLAQRFSIPRVLVAAYYDLSRIRTQDDWDKARSYPWMISPDKESPRSARWGLLSAVDLLYMLRGRERLFEYVESCGLSPGQGGKNCNVCKESRSAHNELFTAAMCSRDPLRVLREFQPRQKLCSRCAEEFDQGRKEFRRVIWEELPGIFELPIYQGMF